MANSKKKQTTQASVNSSPVGLVLVVLIVAAVGALAYLSGKVAGESTSAPSNPSAVQQAEGSAASENQIEIEPGNPVVAVVDGEDIARSDVLNFIQNMPANMRQLPIEQLFTVAQEQVINARVINNKVEGVTLNNDPQVKEQLEAAKEQIVRNVYINNQVTERVTQERIQEAYDQYVQNFPDVVEVRARHILVEDKGTARDLIKQINDGADFAELALENSTDATARNGGDLGYFLKDDVVPAFGEAAFSVEPGSVTQKPVETEFGYHVIMVEEKRMRPVPSLEEAAPFLEAQLRRVFLDRIVQEWRADHEIKRLDINGKEASAAPADVPAEAPTP